MADISTKLGLILILAAVTMAAASDSGMIPVLWNYVEPVATAGVVILAFGIGLRILSKIGSLMTGNKCSRCGKSIKKSRIYCDSCEEEVVEEYEEEQR